MLELKIARNIQELKPYQDEWNHLAVNAPQKVPELSYAWVSSYLECSLDSNEDWICLLAVEDDHLAGVLPVVFEGNSSQFDTVVNLRAPNDLQTQSVDIVADPELEMEVIPFLLGSLGAVFPGWKELKMTRLSEYSPLLKYARSKPMEYIFLEDLNGYGGYLLVHGTYDDFFAMLGSNFRHNLRSHRRKLESIPGFRTYKVLGKEAEKSHFDVFIELEARGWKGRNGTSIRDSEKNFCFYQRLVERLAKSGFMEWHFMEAEGKVLAAAMSTRLGRIVHTPKIAYNEDYKALSPGHQMNRDVIEHAYLEHDVDEINFMTDTVWLSSWRVEKRKYYDLWIYPKNIGAMLFKAAPFKAKESLRKVPGLKPAVKAFRSLLGK